MENLRYSGDFGSFIRILKDEVTNRKKRAEAWKSTYQFLANNWRKIHMADGSALQKQRVFEMTDAARENADLYISYLGDLLYYLPEEYSCHIEDAWIDYFPNLKASIRLVICKVHGEMKMVGHVKDDTLKELITQTFINHGIRIKENERAQDEQRYDHEENH